jgi:LysM repeat protein
MNREDPYRDQAERLRKRIEKINEVPQDDNLLPPRSDLHRAKKKKTKWKLKYPIIRLLVLFFILLPITIFSIYSYLDGKKPIGSEKVNGTSEGFETINYEKKGKTEQKQADQDKQQKTDGKSDLNELNKNTATSFTGADNAETATEQADSVEPISNSSDKSGSEQNTSNQESSSTETSQTNNSDQAKMVYHTVQPEETIYRIAMKYYHSNTGIDTIKEVNHLQNNNIKTGQVLKIPLEK